MKREQVLPILLQVEEMIRKTVPEVQIAIISEYVFEFLALTARDTLSDLCRQLYTRFPNVEAVVCVPNGGAYGQHSFRIRLIWECKKKPWEAQD
jgi:hypothetical protein